MQTVSTLYNNIISGKHWFETGVCFGDVTDSLLINEEDDVILFGTGNNATGILLGADTSDLYIDYGENVLTSIKTTQGIIKDNKPQVGCAIASEIDLSMLKPVTNIPRMSKIRVYVRACNETQTSEWLPKGVFFIDTRSTDKATNVLTIHGYDSMLKTEQIYAGETVWSSKPMRTVVNEIASAISVSIDARTQTLMQTLPNYNVSYNNTLTMRQYLEAIGAAWGGSWVFSDKGELRLVRYVDSYISQQNLAQSVQSFDETEPLDQIGRIVLNVSSEEYYESGGGFEFDVDCVFGTQTMADNLRNLFLNYVYNPFIATNCPTLNPALEIGDGITVNGVQSFIGRWECNFGKLMASDISAPYDEEIDHEYPYKSSITETVERRLARAVSTLEVLPSSIIAQVAQEDKSWDTSGQVINYYGYGLPSDEGDYTLGQTYLNQTDGKLYTYDGGAWTYTAQMPSKWYQKVSSVEITASGIEIKSTGSINLQAGSTINASSTNISLDENGNLRLNGTLYVNGNIIAGTFDAQGMVSQVASIGSNGLGLDGSPGGAWTDIGDWSALGTPTAVFG